ncbi:MAG TPA: aminotransferase class III-fold pyridoxal phosphate-dependent enzyme, partial [Mycobacteriales bacterium]|nr:aminotransferase class III-fold pyridoxal phosphate-dependent enzyme [Mycobacteriales bacterium]
NDADALARELASEDVACVLMEPALTNIGIVLPQPGFLDEVRRLTRETGTLLVVDETHTFSAGWGGATTAWGLQPDAVTIGKAIGGGVPIGAYGLTDELAERLLADRSADIVDTGGVGGTLAGNALSLAAARATLDHVLTEDAFARMTALASRFTDGVRRSIEAHDLAWSVTQLGARTEYRFTSPPPRSGGESAAAAVPELDDLLHVYAANRGILLTPFHNMALMCPATTEADVDLHTSVFGDALAELVG